MESTSSVDVVYEILSHCSLQTLGKCRLLSNDFNAVTYNSNFMKLHNQRSKTIYGFFVQRLRFGKFSSSFISAYNPNGNAANLSLDFLPESVKIEASTIQGLVLCVGQEYNHRIPRYYVCKPSTREWRMIPRPKTRYFNISFGICVLSYRHFHYKIVRLSRPKCGRYLAANRMRCELFDSYTWRWKKVEDVCFRLPNELLCCKPAVSLCGSFHWLTTGNHILSYDIEDESYGVFSLPDELVNNVQGSYYSRRLVSHQGKLALVCTKEEGLGHGHLPELWVLENYFENVWRRRQIINIKDCRDVEPHTRLVEFFGSDVALLEGWRTMFYNFRDGSTIENVKVKDYIDSKWIFPFQSDNEPPFQLDNEPGVDHQMMMDRMGSGFSGTLVFIVLFFLVTYGCFLLDD